MWASRRSFCSPTQTGLQLCAVPWFLRSNNYRFLPNKGREGPNPIVVNWSKPSPSFLCWTGHVNLVLLTETCFVQNKLQEQLPCTVPSPGWRSCSTRSSHSHFLLLSGIQNHCLWHSILCPYICTSLVLTVPNNYTSFLRNEGNCFSILISKSKLWGAPGLGYQTLSSLRTGEDWVFLPPKLLPIREGPTRLVLSPPMGRPGEQLMIYFRSEGLRKTTLSSLLWVDNFYSVYLSIMVFMVNYRWLVFLG